MRDRAASASASAARAPTRARSAVGTTPTMRVIVVTSVDWPACGVRPVTGPGAWPSGAPVGPTGASAVGKASPAAASAAAGDVAPPAGVLAP